MIPRTFPSSRASNGSTQMIVYFLPSVSGLTRWVDYIPVKFTTVATAATENTYNQNGYIPVVSISSIAGATPFKEYVPVFLDSSAADADVWDVNITGFIPVGTAGIGGAALYMDFAATTTLDPRVTFSRTTNATLTNSAGLVANAPMNLLTFSEQFDNAAWTKSNATVTANSTVAPNGSTTADKLVENTAATTQHRIDITPVSSAVPQTFSVYAKAAERNFMGLRIGTIGAAFDLSNGTSGNVSVGSTASITDVGSGWYRCSVTVTAPTANDICRINLATTLNRAQDYTGDGVSGIYIWGAQLELGSTATTYNPTTVKNLLGFTENFDNAAWTKSNAFVQTNLLTNSEDFSNAIWAKINTTVSAGVLSPAGTTAQKIAQTTVSAISVTQEQVVNATSATFTVYAKQGSGATDINRFAIRNVTAGTNLLFVDLDYSTGAITYVIGSSGASAQAVGDGWWRVQLVIPSGITSGNTLRVYAGASGGTYPSGAFAYIWGAQLVQGTSAGDYKATYATAAAVGYTDIYGQPFAQKLVETTAASSHFTNQTATVVNGSSYTYSVYAKKGERNYVSIFCLGTTATANTFFNLNTGVVVSTSANATSSIQDIGNGWYRCSVTATTNATTSGIYPGISVDGVNASYTGDGTSGIYIFGAQLSDSASVDPYVYQPVAAPSSVAYYGPRFDYDPVTLAPKGLLIEEQRSNLLLNSATLSTQVVTVAATAHTLSFYGTGTIVLSGASTGTVVGTGAYPARTTLTFTPTVGVLTLTVTGSVTMAQLEAGAFATSYIPTVASQVTRAADSASMIGNNFARWYNVNEGTPYADGVNGAGLSDSTYNDFIFQVNDGSFANVIGLNWSSSQIRSTIRVNNVSVGLAAGSSVANAPYKTALAYKTNDSAISLNGAAAVTTSSVAIPLGLNQARIGGRFNGTGFFCGHIKRIAYYNRRLSNSELQAITS